MTNEALSKLYTGSELRLAKQVRNQIKAGIVPRWIADHKTKFIRRGKGNNQYVYEKRVPRLLCTIDVMVNSAYE